MSGLRVSPSNIYKAIPWTWCIDWMTHFGDNITAIDDMLLDQIAYKYLYLMHHHLETTTLKQYLPLKTGGNITLEWTRVNECKQRAVGLSPYGFDLSWSNLTPRQLAILAAIGLTR
jgi:hypothetical protein